MFPVSPPAYSTSGAAAQFSRRRYAIAQTGISPAIKLRVMKSAREVESSWSSGLPQEYTLEGLIAGAFRAYGKFNRTLCMSLKAPLAPAERLLSLPGYENKILWSPSPDDEHSGVGAAYVLAATGESRFLQIRDAATRLFQELAVVGLDGDPAPDPRLIGGFAFQPARVDSAIWRGFGDAQFILPRIAYTRRAQHAWLTLSASRHELSSVEGRARIAREAGEALRALRREDSATPEVSELVEIDEAEEIWSALVTGIRGRSPRAGSKRQSRRGASCCAERACLHRRECFSGCGGRAEIAHASRFRSAIALSSVPPLNASSNARACASGRKRSQDPCKATIRRTGISVSQPEKSRRARHRRARDSHLARAALRVAQRRRTGPASVASRLAPAYAFRRHPTGTPACARPRRASSPDIGRRRGAAGRGSRVACRERTHRTGTLRRSVRSFRSLRQRRVRVAIRSGLLAANEAHLFAGAGIVEGSDVESELCETRWKLRSLMAAIGIA